MRRWADLLEKAFHVVMLSLIASAVIPLWREMSGYFVDPYQGDTLSRSLLLVGYFLVVFKLLFKPTWIGLAFSRGWLIWGLILWSAISFFWSAAPDVTLRRSVAVLLTTLYGFYLSYRYSVEEFIRIVGFLFLILLSGSLLTVLFFPEWGIMTFPHDGAWRGIFIHKNMLGRFSALASLVFILLLRQDGGFHWLFGLGLSVVLLIGSRSATSLVLFGAMLFLLVYLGLEWRFRRFRGIWRFYFLILLSIGAMFLTSNTETILGVLGKDLTLTGRVPLWSALIPFAVERLWTGYGLGGFWLGLEGPSGEVSSIVNWEVPHGHNGYLDLVLELGLPGLALGVMLLVLMSFRTWKIYLLLGPTLRSNCFLGMTAFLVIYNFAESNFLRANNLFWLLLVWIYSVSHGMSQDKRALDELRRLV